MHRLHCSHVFWRMSFLQLYSVLHPMKDGAPGRGSSRLVAAAAPGSGCAIVIPKLLGWLVAEGTLACVSRSNPGICPIPQSVMRSVGVSCSCLPSAPCDVRCGYAVCVDDKQVCGSSWPSLSGLTTGPAREGCCDNGSCRWCGCAQAWSQIVCAERVCARRKVNPL
jgi:hypothetical protein